jgi:hypothetical protein
LIDRPEDEVMSDGTDPELQVDNGDAKILHGFLKTEGTNFMKDVISSTDREFIRC